MSYFSIPDDRLPWVMDRLTSAELMRRQSSDFRSVIAEHNELSQYFERHGDKQGAVDQLLRALQAAEDSLDPALEGEAHQTLAFCYERFGLLAESLRHHEIRMKLAEMSSAASADGRSSGNGDHGIAPENVKDAASKNLIHIYDAIGSDFLSQADEIKNRGSNPQLHLQAKSQERRNDEESYRAALDQARSYFVKAVDVAKNLAGNNTNGNETLAKCYKKLGHVTVLIGDLSKALEYNQRFLQAARGCDTSEGKRLRAIVCRRDGATGEANIESRAALEVAKVQRALGHNNEAISSLKEALNVAQRSRDLWGVNRACRHLAETYRSDGQNIPAAHYFRESFKVSQELRQLEWATEKDSSVKALLDRGKSVKEQHNTIQTDNMFPYMGNQNTPNATTSATATDQELAQKQQADDEQDGETTDTRMLVEDARIRLGFTLGEHYFSHAGSNGSSRNELQQTTASGERRLSNSSAAPKRTGFLNLVVEDLPAQLEWMSTGTL